MKLNDIKNITKEDVLAALGLSVRPSAMSAVLTSVGLVGLGFVAGAATALLLAPKTGRELRAQLGSGLNDVKRRVAERAQELTAEEG